MTGPLATGWPMTFPDVIWGWVPALNIFNNEAAAMEMIAAQLLFASRLPGRVEGARSRSVGAVALMAVTVVCLVEVVGFVDSHMIRSLISFSLLFAASIALMRYVCCCDVRSATGIANCGYALQHVAAALVEIAEIGLAWVSDASGNPWVESWTVSETMRIAVFAAVYVGCWRWYIRGFDVTKVRMSSPTVLAALTVSVLLVTIGLSSYAYAVELDVITQLAVRSVSVLTCIIILMLFNELSRNQILSDELEFARRMNEMQGDYYERLKDAIDTANVHYHDLKHQLVRIRAAADRDSADRSDVRQVLDDLAHRTDDYDGVAQTGNAALDVVLTHKTLAARRKGIRLTYMADAGNVVWIDDYDLYSLFGNMLDNALEATERLGDPERRVVKLTVTGRTGMTMIRISNYFDDIHYDEQGRLRTGKADAASHGYGMASIRMIVERLGGEMAVTADEGIFTLSIVLPRPTDE